MTSRIHDLKVYAVEPGLNLNIGDDLPLKPGNIIVRIRTDDGHEGIAGMTCYGPPRSVAYAVAETSPTMA